MEDKEKYLEVLRNCEDHFEILALYLDQEDGKSKCWTELDVAGVGKQKIRQGFKEITNQQERDRELIHRY